MLIILSVFFGISLYYMYFRHTRKQLYAFSDSLPSAGSLPVLGHSHWFLGGPERLLKNIKQLCETLHEIGDVTKIWIGPSLYIVTFKPDDIQIILENCLEKDYSYKFLQTWLGNGLFVAPVELWKMHRRLLLPIFHNHIIEDYIDVFGEQGAILVERLRDRAGGQEFDVHTYITSCMLDIVFEAAMGEKMDVQHTPDTPYMCARKSVMSVISMRLFKPWMQPDILFNLTPCSKQQRINIDITHKFTDEVVTKKRNKVEEQIGMSVDWNDNQTRKDLLELLLSNKLNLNDKELREHIDSITIAGNDTTALVVSYALMLLGCYQDEQDKVYNELKNIFDGSLRAPTKADLCKMENLERVIKETMRLYTVVPIIGRKTQKEVKLSTCTVPKGVGCAVVPFVLHRSKKIWGPDADCFNPDRFLPEHCAKRHPCSFIPFSYGPRNCIGIKLVILYML
ncbi:hypothetical protein O3G_MSEX002762 [Manduca sexta]|uniref:Cytochrome P450 n=1 Tax=Manduca sexta TaxID=7130 RepID=A0A921YPV9_MANSE|nr:hypothetical protein O3G_MSEX002762 [Manduca sexta]